MASPALARALAALGGLLALAAGVYSVLADEPLIAALTGGAVLGDLSGARLDLMGVIGIIGGVLALASLQAGLWAGVVVGGLLGLVAPCGLAVLAVAGGVLMRR